MLYTNEVSVRINKTDILMHIYLTIVRLYMHKSISRAAKERKGAALLDIIILLLYFTQRNILLLTVVRYRIYMY